MKPLQLRDKWVLVTGASSGLGHELAIQLAKNEKANLVLTARRTEKLEALAQKLEKEHDVKVKIYSADLANEAEAEALFFKLEKDITLYAAVLNAGITHFGHHDELSWVEFKRMIAINVNATARLSTLLLPYLEARKENGALMLISSMAGLAPVPYQTAYSATKAFLMHFGAGLHHEMWPRGVSVTTFAPGGIITEMTEGERFNSLRGWLMPVERCAASALKSFKNREYIAIPGTLYRVGSVLQRLVPQRFFVGQVAKQYRKSLVSK